MSENTRAAGDATSTTANVTTTYTPMGVGSGTTSTNTPPEPKSTEPAKSEGELGDAGKNAIAAERKAKKEAEQRAAALQAKVDEFEKAKLSEQERAERELADARKAAEAARQEAAAAQLDALRHRIAFDKKVPAELLTGVTEEDLVASAEKALAWRGSATPEQPKAPRPDPSVGPRGEQPVSGAELYRRTHPSRTPAAT